MKTKLRGALSPLSEPSVLHDADSLFVSSLFTRPPFLALSSFFSIGWALSRVLCNRMLQPDSKCMCNVAGCTGFHILWR